MGNILSIRKECQGIIKGKWPEVDTVYWIIHMHTCVLHYVFVYIYIHMHIAMQYNYICTNVSYIMLYMCIHI